MAKENVLLPWVSDATTYQETLKSKTTYPVRLHPGPLLTFALVQGMPLGLHKDQSPYLREGDFL